MDLLPSVMRTGVPIIYAVLIRLGIGGLGLPDATVTNIATVILTVLVYLALRGLEELKPKIGLLLGWVGAPRYDEKMTDDELAQWRSATLPELDAALAKVKADLVTEFAHELNRVADRAKRKPAPKPAKG